MASLIRKLCLTILLGMWVTIGSLGQSLQITNVTIESYSNLAAIAVQFNQAPDVQSATPAGQRYVWVQTAIGIGNTSNNIPFYFPRPGSEYSIHPPSFRTNHQFYSISYRGQNNGYDILRTNTYLLQSSNRKIIMPTEYPYNPTSTYTYVVYFMKSGEYVGTNIGVIGTQINPVSPPRNLRVQ